MVLVRGVKTGGFGGGGGGGGSSTSTNSTKPVYNKNVLPVYQAEADLLKDYLLPIEAGFQKDYGMLSNPDKELTPRLKAPITQGQGYASQVAQYMPESMEASSFVDDFPELSAMELRRGAPTMLAGMNRSLVDPRFQNLFGPSGSTSVSTGKGPGAPDQTGQMVMSGIGTAASIAGVAIAL